MSGSNIVSLIALVMCLILALRNIQAHGLSFETKAWMMVAWLLIFAVAAFVAGQFST